MYWSNPFSRYHWYYWMRFGMFPKFMRWLTDCLAPGVPHHHLPHISLIENSKISYLEIGLRKELYKLWFLNGIYFDKDIFIQRQTKVLRERKRIQYQWNNNYLHAEIELMSFKLFLLNEMNLYEMGSNLPQSLFLWTKKSDYMTARERHFWTKI